MTTLKERITRKILVKTAAREIKKEIEQAGLDTLKELADLGGSIVGTYLKSRSPQEKKRRKQELTILLQMGVTPEMILTELARQLPELAPIMEGREGYKKSELQNLEQFLKEG